MLLIAMNRDDGFVDVFYRLEWGNLFFRQHRMMRFVVSSYFSFNPVFTPPPRRLCL